MTSLEGELAQFRLNFHLINRHFYLLDMVSEYSSYSCNAIITLIYHRRELRKDEFLVLISCHLH